MGQLFDDDEWAFEPASDSGDDPTLAFDRYVREGIALIEDWLRHPDSG